MGLVYLTPVVVRGMDKPDNVDGKIGLHEWDTNVDGAATIYIPEGNIIDIVPSICGPGGDFGTVTAKVRAQLGAQVASIYTNQTISTTAPKSYEYTS